VSLRSVIKAPSSSGSENGSLLAPVQETTDKGAQIILLSHKHTWATGATGLGGKIGADFDLKLSQ
jgi:hypothetical protein